jgi:Zn-dependent metalloprotease
LREDDKNFKDLTTRTTETGWIEFKKEAKVDHNNFFKNHANSLGLAQNYEFKATKDETDDKQQRHQRFQLHYKNILIEGAEFSLRSKDGIVNTAHGRVIDGLNIDISKPMNERAHLCMPWQTKN